MANKGLKEENTMLSFSISDVNISIDLAKLNKNIIATIPLTIDKGPMPINVGVIYNDQNKNVASNFGNGFRFSEDKTISLIPGGGGYKIENSDGSENIFTFYGPTEDGSIYKDIYGNKLYDLSFDDYDEFKLEDKYNNFIRFLEDSSNQISVINHLGKYAYVYNYGGNYFELYNEYNDVLKLENTNPQVDSYIDTYTYKENNVVIYSGSISYDSNRINGIVITKNQSSVRDISIDYDTVNNKRIIIFKNNITKEIIKIEIDLPNELSIEVNEGYFDDNNEYIIKTTTIDYYDNKTIVTDKDLVTTSNSYISTYLFDNNYLLENIIDNSNYVKALKYNNQIKQKEFETSNIYQGNDSNFILDLADYTLVDNNNTISLTSVTPTDYTAILSLMYKNGGSGYIFHSFPQTGIGGEAKGLVLWVKNKSGSGNLKVTFRLGVTKDEIILSEQEILPDYQMICLGITMYTSFLFMDFRIEITGSLELEFGRLEILDYNPKQVYLYEGNNLVGVNNQNNNSYNNYNLNNIVDSSYGTNTDSKRYQYNSNNLVTKEIMPYGVEKEYNYSGLNLTSVSLKDNGTTIWTDNYSYTNNELTRVFNKYTELTEYQYSNHNISHKQIGTVNATFYSYNNYDDVTEVLRSISEKININYENDRKIDNVEVYNGISYDYTYDNKNRITSVSRESVVIESYTYDNNGLITSITKIDRKTLITYNNKKQITNIKLTNLAGTIIYKEYNFSYDSKLRLINVSDGNNHVLKTYNYNIHENNDNLLSVNYLNGDDIIYELDYIYHHNKMVYKNYVNDSGKLYIEEINRNNFISKNLMNLDNYIRLSTNLIGTSFLEGLVLKGSDTLSVPSVISGSTPPDRLINNIYTITTKPQTAYLCYEGGIYQDNSDAIGIAFWFNFDTISNDKYLFTIAQADSPNARKVFCYIDSLKITIKILNSNGNLKTIMTSPVIIDTNTWHFIGFSYENDYEAEDDTFIYRLNVDGRYIEYITSDLQEQLGRVSNAKYYIGYYYDNNVQSIMDGYITALAISNGRIINNYDLDVYYKISKEFVIKPLDIDGAINYSAVNEYKKELLTNYDIIPLHSSVISLKNEKPTKYNEVVGNRFVHNNFNYNKNLRNMCFTPNDMLEYDYNISNSGTIIMDVFINSISDVSYLVQNHGNSYMSLYLEGNELVLEYRNNPSSPFVTKHTNLFVTTNYWHKIGLSFSASNFRIDFSVFLDDSMYYDWKYLSTVFSPMKTVIVSTSLGKYALDGNISMVAIGQGLIDQNEFNNVKNNLTCYTSLIKYDKFNHLFKKEINKNRFNILTTTFVYDKDRIISQTTKTIQKNYLYDSVGNISGITDSGTYNHSYGYDKYNRIVDYDNTSNYYSYDSEGNIISAGNTSFTYDSNNMLTHINSEQITYSNDNYMLPTHYKDMDFSWIGTKLEKVIVDLSNNESVEIEFEYNEKGLRSKKIEKHKQNQTVLYTNIFSYYYDEEDRLITEIRNSDRYDYLYDETGIYGYVINLNARYYYIKDIIGQIIGIANESGTIIGRYDYDPFGNILMNTFASTNKILYKGYYYDDYIDLYYLKTRYYSPTWHRFISPDSIDYLDIYDLNGVNLFSYCNNNPVMGIDPDGTLAILAALGIGAVVGLFSQLATDLVSNVISYGFDFSSWHFSSWQSYVGAGVGGAVGGVLALAAGPAVTAFVDGFISTMTSMSLENITGASNYSFGEILFTTLFVASFSGVTAGLLEGATKSAKDLTRHFADFSTENVKNIPKLIRQGILGNVPYDIINSFTNGIIITPKKV